MPLIPDKILIVRMAMVEVLHYKWVQNMQTRQVEIFNLPPPQGGALMVEMPDNCDIVKYANRPSFQGFIYGDKFVHDHAEDALALKILEKLEWQGHCFSVTLGCFGKRQVALLSQGDEDHGPLRLHDTCTESLLLAVSIVALKMLDVEIPMTDRVPVSAQEVEADV